MANRPDFFFTPTRLSPSRPGEKPKAELPQHADAQALQTLVSLFDYTATADRIEAAGHDKPKRCGNFIEDTGDRCNHALRNGEARCAFHKEAHMFRGLGLTENDVYKGSPREAEIRTRYIALKA